MALPAPVAIGANNPRLRRLRSLTGRAKARSQERAFVVDGPTLIADALRSSLVVSEIYGSADALADHDLGLGDLHSPPFDGEIFEVEESVLTAVLDPVNPRAVAAVVEIPEWGVEALGRDEPVLVAVEIRDPGNLGTMMRTAEAAGLAGLVIVGDSVDWTAPKVVRASAGSAFRIPIIRIAEIAEAFSALGATGRKLLCAVVDPSAAIYDEADLVSAAIVVGNEPHGLPPEAITLGDGLLTIPVSESVESLNVAAAASVLCFEAARQRRAAGTRSGNSLDK